MCPRPKMPDPVVPPAPTPKLEQAAPDMKKASDGSERMGGTRKYRTKSPLTIGTSSTANPTGNVGVGR